MGKRPSNLGLLSRIEHGVDAEEIRCQLALAGLHGLDVKPTTDRHVVVDGTVDKQR